MAILILPGLGESRAVLGSRRDGAGAEGVKGFLAGPSAEAETDQPLFGTQWACFAQQQPLPGAGGGVVFRQWLRQHPLLGQRKAAGEALGGIDQAHHALVLGQRPRSAPPSTLAWSCVLSLTGHRPIQRVGVETTLHFLQSPPLTVSARGIIFLAFNYSPTFKRGGGGDLNNLEPKQRSRVGPCGLPLPHS